MVCELSGMQVFPWQQPSGQFVALQEPVGVVQVPFTQVRPPEQLPPFPTHVLPSQHDVPPQLVHWFWLTFWQRPSWHCWVPLQAWHAPPLDPH